MFLPTSDTKLLLDRPGQSWTRLRSAGLTLRCAPARLRELDLDFCLCPQLADLEPLREVGAAVRRC